MGNQGVVGCACAAAEVTAVHIRPGGRDEMDEVVLGVTTAEHDEGKCDDPAPEVQTGFIAEPWLVSTGKPDQPRHLAVLV